MISSLFNGILMDTIFGAATFIVALVVIVFIHEYGHFKVARLFGFAIDTFSIGFGRKIFGFKDRYGTNWKIGWLPLGGYVKFQGDTNAASLPDGSAPIRAGDFQGQPLWQRAMVVAAGPFANFILAIVLFAAVILMTGMPVIGTTIGKVVPGSAAEQAGLAPGDIIRSIAGSPTSDFSDIRMAVTTRPGETVQIVVERNGTATSLPVTIREEVQDRGFLGKIKYGIIGINPSEEAANKTEVGPLGALKFGIAETWRICAVTVRFIGKLFTGNESLDKVGGLASMATVANEAANNGLAAFLHTVGLLSVSIGLINLFPIPMLDGGHLVFYGLEALRRKPLGQQAQEMAFKVGFMVVLALMFIGNFNDLLRGINHLALGQ